MVIGVLLVLVVVPWLAWDWDSDRWRHPIPAGIVLAVGSGLIGYAIGAGPD
jgi:hypothetical protein